MFQLSGPVISISLEPDFYKFTMGQLIWCKYSHVEVTFAFRNRTAKAKIGNVIDIGELREQFDHARSLMFTNTEIHYLRGTNEYQQRMFDEGYLEFLRQLRLPDYHVRRDGSALEVTFQDRGPKSRIGKRSPSPSSTKRTTGRCSARSRSSNARRSMQRASGGCVTRSASCEAGRTSSPPISGHVEDSQLPGSNSSTRR